MQKILVVRRIFSSVYGYDVTYSRKRSRGHFDHVHRPHTGIYTSKCSYQNRTDSKRKHRNRNEQENCTWSVRVHVPDSTLASRVTGVSPLLFCLCIIASCYFQYFFIYFLFFFSIILCCTHLVLLQKCCNCCLVMNMNIYIYFEFICNSFNYNSNLLL